LSKSSDVTVRPVAGASVALGAINLQVVSHLHFTGTGGSMSVNGVTIDRSDTRPNCSSHLTFDYLRYTAAMDILPRCASMAILADHNNLNNVPASSVGEGRINVQAMNQGPNADQGIAISNSTFNGGCSKGVQILGGAYGVQVLYNEFAFLPDQSYCDTVNGIHIGGIQIYGGRYAHIKGNYFHDNGTSAGGLNMGDGDNTTVEDNVWVCTCIYPWSIQAYATHDSIFRHNTFAGGGGLHFQYQSGYPANNIVRDNVFTDPGNGITDSSGANWGTHDHNLNSGLSGTGEITGTPSFVLGGGYNGYHLAAGSPGKSAASDGTDMGIR
jgi:Right handed beta helix region